MISNLWWTIFCGDTRLWRGVKCIQLVKERLYKGKDDGGLGSNNFETFKQASLARYIGWLFVYDRLLKIKNCNINPYLEKYVGSKMGNGAGSEGMSRDRMSLSIWDSKWIWGHYPFRFINFLFFCFMDLIDHYWGC